MLLRIASRPAVIALSRASNLLLKIAGRGVDERLMGRFRTHEGQAKRKRTRGSARRMLLAGLCGPLMVTPLVLGATQAGAGAMSAPVAQRGARSAGQSVLGLRGMDATSPAVPSAFVGLSMETWDVNRYFGTPGSAQCHLLASSSELGFRCRCTGHPCRRRFGRLLLACSKWTDASPLLPIQSIPHGFRRSRKLSCH